MVIILNRTIFTILASYYDVKCIHAIALINLRVPQQRELLLTKVAVRQIVIVRVIKYIFVLLEEDWQITRVLYIIHTEII